MCSHFDLVQSPFAPAPDDDEEDEDEDDGDEDDEGVLCLTSPHAHAPYTIFRNTPAAECVRYEAKTSNFP